MNIVGTGLVSFTNPLAFGSGLVNPLASSEAGNLSRTGPEFWLVPPNANIRLSFNISLSTFRVLL